MSGEKTLCLQNSAIRDIVGCTGRKSFNISTALNNLVSKK